MNAVGTTGEAGADISGENAGAGEADAFTFFLPGITIARTIPTTATTPPTILSINGSEKVSILPNVFLISSRFISTTFSLTEQSTVSLFLPSINVVSFPPESLYIPISVISSSSYSIVWLIAPSRSTPSVTVTSPFFNCHFPQKAICGTKDAATITAASTNIIAEKIIFFILFSIIYIIITLNNIINRPQVKIYRNPS